MILLENKEKVKSLPQNKRDKSGEILQLIDDIDLKIYDEKRKLTYCREMCRNDRYMGRLCDVQEELLEELTLLNRRYRHE